jgi:hypothetical protein
MINKEFILMSAEHIQHNTECKSEDHDKHLCYLISQGFNLSNIGEFKALTNKPKYQCNHCKRKANSDENLCVPARFDAKSQ